MLEQYLWFITTNWFTVIISLILIMIILNYATWVLEKEISTIWKKLKILPSVRWAIFDASMSSLPEFLTALVWLFILWEKWLEVGTWTIWGSALFNILIIPAAVLLAYNWKKPIKIDPSSIKRDSIFYFLSIIVILVWLYFNQLKITSIALITVYVSYIFYLYKQSLNHRNQYKESIEKDYENVKNIKISYLKIFIWLAIVYLGVEVAVSAAEWMWKELHVSTFIISLVVLAGITSIPDTMLSIKASNKWDVDAWFSNAVGSNIFDICIWLWVPMFIWTFFMWLHPVINFKDNFYLFMFVILATIIYLIVLNLNNISKKTWYALLILYILIIIYIIIR